MRTLKVVKTVITMGVIAACASCLAACSVFSGIHGVAATVNGVDIKEDDVTQLVETLRAQTQTTNNDQWGLYLAMNSQTPSSVRDSYISLLRDRELLMEGAPELGITLDTATVDMQIESLKANFSTEAAWQKSLSDAGWTEDEYRAYVESQVLSSQIQKYFESQVELTDENMVEAAALYVPYYYDGRKRSSHILFQVADTSDAAAMAAAREKAQSVLDRINDGSLSFEDAVSEYSDDTGSAAQGGDVGYATENLVTEYLQGLNDLEVGQMAIVETQFGVHIIKCTEEYKAPEEITSLDQVPETFHDGIKEAAKYMQAQNAYKEWLTGLRDAATFTQNPMPSGLPYDLDISKYEKQYAEYLEAAEASSEESAAASTESSASASSASAESSASSASSESASSESASSASSESSASSASA